MPKWEVELYIFGPVTIKGQIALHEPKGSNPDDLFYSDISLRSNPTGVTINLTARADNEKLARRVSQYYVGHTLDVLTLSVRQPLYLSLFDRQPIRPATQHVRRIVERDEWHNAFESARDLNEKSTTFLRALSWYRKGLYTEDPFDKFLAFWNSIESVANKNHPKGTCLDKDNKDKGSKCHIWECFKLIWGECNMWPVITGEIKWIDDNYSIRKDIAHGVMPVNIRRVEEVLNKLETIEEVAYKFLTDWKTHKV